MGMLDELLLKELKAKPIGREHAAGLYQSVDKIAGLLGSKPPVIHLVPQGRHTHPMLELFSNVPNAASVSADAIILSKPALKLYDSVNLANPLSKEMEGVIAHEMHHCAHRTRMMLTSRAPVFLLPLAAMTGVYLYDRAQAKAKAEKDTSPQNLSKHVEGEAKTLSDTLPRKDGEHTVMDKALSAGKYMAAAALGIGAGLMAARYGTRFEEFAADKFAASVVGKEEMVNALRKVHKALGASISETHQPQKWQGIILETFMAHPTFAERAAHIRS